MDALSFDQVSYISGGHRLFLISGEIHYFRVPRENWVDRLEKMKAAGGNCVATYVPWLIHEPREGTYTFDDQLDVEAFLEACRTVGIWAMVRPGPYQYSELAYDGLPGWLTENYPQLRAHNIDGQPFRTESISYTHPLMLEKTRRWYEQIIPRLARHQASNGGAVIAFQFDNELIGIHEWHGSLDYNRTTMGIGQEQGRWPDYLKRKYGTAEAAALAYGMSATSFAQIIPPTSAAGQITRARAAKDYQECYLRQIGDYASTLVGWMCELGVQTPVVHNSGGPMMNALFVETIERLGDGFLLGSDHYYNLTLNWPQNNPTPKYAVNNYCSLEFLRTRGMPPTVFELPGGSCNDFPPFTAHDAACAYLMNIAFGMKGYNYYIFAGGYNRPGTGTTADVYDYGAAVAPDGSLRPVYAVQRGLAAFLQQHPFLAGSRLVHDVRIGLDHDLQRAARHGDASSLLLAGPKAWDLMRDGLLTTGFCAGVSPSMADLRNASLAKDTATPLAVLSWDCMDVQVQRNLVAFLRAGGSLLLLGVVPTMDADYQPCTILRDAFGGCSQQVRKMAAPRLDTMGVENVYVTGPLFACTNIAADAQVTARQVKGEPFDVGFFRTLPSGGRVSVLGFAWMQGMRTHEQMLRNALTALGWKRRIECDNPNVWCVLRSDGRQSLLFALNLLTAPMEFGVSYLDEHDQRRSADRTTIPGISVAVWDGSRWTLPARPQ